MAALVDHDPLLAPAVVLVANTGEDNREGNDEELGSTAAGAVVALGCSALKTLPTVMIG